MRASACAESDRCSLPSSIDILAPTADATHAHAGAWVESCHLEALHRQVNGPSLLVISLWGDNTDCLGTHLTRRHCARDERTFF